MAAFKGSMLVPWIGVGIVILLLWKKLESLFKSLTDVNQEGQRGNSFNYTDNKGENQIFNVWTVGSYQKLVSNGYNVKIWTPSYVAFLVSALHDSGVIVERDDDIKAVIYQVSTKTQFNQLVTYYYNNSNWFEKKDLHEYLKSGLSDENFDNFIKYLNKLPNGF